MIVKLVKKTTDKWSGVKFYKNCYHAIGSYYTRTGRRYTGLEKEDAESIGKTLGFDLRPESSFWDSFRIKLTSEREEVIIDTDDDYGKLQYKFLKGHKRVAKSIKDITPGKDYVLIEEALEAKSSNEGARIKRKAASEFDTMTPEQMRKALRLYGINASNSNGDIVENTLWQLVEDNPSKFIDVWVNNEDKEIQYLIEEAVSKNILRKNKTKYTYGTDIIGYTVHDAISYLKDPSNRDVRVAILGQLDGKLFLSKSDIKVDTKGEAERLLAEIEDDVKTATENKKSTKKSKD